MRRLSSPRCSKMVSRWRIQRVLRYVREHPGCTEDEIAQALRMHILDVLEALHVLEAEGLVKRGKEELLDDIPESAPTKVFLVVWEDGEPKAVKAARFL